MKTFDAILQHVGNFGSYQRLLLFVYGIYSIAVAVFVYFLFVFLSFGVTDPFECNFPQSLKESLPSGANTSLLYADPSYWPITAVGPWCYIYDYSSSNWTYDGPRVTPLLCPFGFSLAGGRYSETIISKFDLVCDKVAVFTDILTTHYAGGVLGGLIWAPIMDKLGRRLMIWIYHPYVVVVCVCIYFVPNLEALYVFAFLLGMVIRLTFPLPSLYVTEFTDIKWQPFVLAVQVSAFAVGGLMFCLIAYIATSWKTLVLATIVANAIAIPGVLFLEKSPRWLLSVGKVNEAKKIIRNIARINKVEKEESDWLPLESSIDKEFSRKAVHSSGFTFQHLFTSGCSIAVKTIVTSYLIVAGMMIYLGITVSTEMFKADPLLTFAVAITMEMPAGLGAFTARFVGRVRLIVISFLLSGAFSVATIFAIDSSTTMTVIFVVLTRLFISIAWDVATLSNAEIFPTALRASGTGIPNIVGIGATVFVPYLVYAGWTNMSVSLGTFAGMAFLAAIMALFLPETAWTPLIDTFEDEKGVAITRNTFFHNLRTIMTCSDWNIIRRGVQLTPKRAEVELE